MESSASMKTRFKNRGFNLKTWFGVCFKPGGADGDAFEPAAAYKSILSSALTTVKEGGGWRRRRKEADDGFCFWRILKKAFNETTLLKKIKSRKAASKRQIFRPRKSDKMSKDGIIVSNRSLESGGSSIFCPSSSLSSPTGSESSKCTQYTSSNYSGLTPKKHHEDPFKVLCMAIIISLLVLTFWGKLFAVICTSLWFYLVPSRSRQWSRPAGRLKKFDSVEHKKKIVMEGFLKRNRGRGNYIY